jgi:hypothetical protein
MRALPLLVIGFCVCVPARAQKTKTSAKVLAVEVLHYRRGYDSVHCSDDGKSGTDCQVVPADSGSIILARPGYVSSAYIEIGLPDHRLVTLSCDPGFAVWSNLFCTAPEKDSTVQVEFNGKHAVVRWDAKIEKIVSIDKRESRIEHRSEKYEINNVYKNRYFGSIDPSK